MSLTELPSLLRDEPGLTRALGDPSARIAVVEVGATDGDRGPGAAVRTATARGRLPDRRQRRPALRRPHPVHAGRRRRPLPGVGDAAVRAREPERRDDGAAARGAVAAAQPGSHTGHRRRGSARPAAEAWPGGDDDGTDRRPAERDRRSRRADRDARRVRIPARGVGRASRRVRPAGCDRRRVPVDRQRTDPHRSVGRRGRPADALRRQRSALDGRPRRGDDLPGARADADRRRQPPCRRPHRRRAVGTRAVGAPRRGSPLRRDGVVASVARRRGPVAHRCPAATRQGRAGRAAPDARPGDRAARRGRRSRQGARLDVGT